MTCMLCILTMPKRPRDPNHTHGALLGRPDPKRAMGFNHASNINARRYRDWCAQVSHFVCSDVARLVVAYLDPKPLQVECVRARSVEWFLNTNKAPDVFGAGPVYDLISRYIPADVALLVTGYLPVSNTVAGVLGLTPCPMFPCSTGAPCLCSILDTPFLPMHP